LLRGFRQAAGLTQDELARRAGLSLGSIRDLEQGRTQRPEGGTLTALVTALGLNTAQADGLERAAVGRGLWVQVLGPVAAWLNGFRLPVGGPAQRAVLGLLALSVGSLVHRTAIIDVLWPDSPPDNAVNLVQAHLSRLRRALAVDDASGRGPQLSSAGASYRLQAVPSQLDLLRFSQFATDARAAAASNDYAAACHRYEQAIALWQGDALADVDLLRGHPAVTGLARRRTEVVVDYARAASAAGWHGRALPLLRELTGREPLNEQAHAWMMIALAGSGQQAEALSVYHELCRRLDDELAMPAGHDLRQAHELVLRQQIPGARTAAITAATGPNSAVPHPGTGDPVSEPLAAGARHCLPLDAAAFTGRDAELRLIADGEAPRALTARALTARAATASAATDSAATDSAATDSAATDGGVALRVISGMPGVGKTALAVHAAHRLAPAFPDRQMFIDLHGHTPGRDPVSPAAALAELITAIGVDPGFLPADLAGRSAMWRDRLAGERALLVLDNAASSAQITPLLPGSGDCLVLVTSRRQLADLPGVVVQVRLPTLSRETARAMFITNTPRAAGEDSALVDELTRLAGHLPLAISLLARVHAFHPSWTLSDLITETRSSLLAMTAERASVSTAFSISWRHLHPGERRLLALLSLHPGTSTDQHAAVALAGIEVTEAARQLDRLHHECLLVETGYRRYSLHDLIRSYGMVQARTMLTGEEAATAVRRLLGYYIHVGTHENLAWARAERANLLACLDYATAAGWRPEVVMLTAAIAALLRRDGPWPQAERLHAAAVEAARGLADRAALARGLLDLAAVRRLISKHQRANEDLAAALDLYRALGNRAGEAATLVELSHVRTLDDDFESAAGFACQALRIYRAMNDRPGQARALTLAGNLRRRTADFAGASEALTEAVMICRELGDSAGLAFALRQLGDVRRLTCDYAAAEASLSESIELSRELDDWHAQATALAWLGGVRWFTGDCQAAARDLEQALNLHRDHGNRLGQANALGTLGDVRHSAGDHTAALRDLEQALRLHRDIGGPSGEASTLGRLGKVRLAIGDYEAAGTDLCAAISISRKLGDRGSEATSLAVLAKLHLTRADIAEARRLYQQTLGLARQATSPWDEAHALAGLGRCAQADGDLRTAAGLLTQAYRIFHRIGAADAAQVAAERDSIAG
jgi:DNA-binding SARP family transcriptional activator